MHLPIGTLLHGGRYEIIRYIGSGGFGCTYEARDTTFKGVKKSIAIKEFFVKDFCNRDAVTNYISATTQNKTGLLDKLRAKFLAEADALYGLNHPNIVRVTHKFEENYTAYYVMEYIDGSSLADIVKEKGWLSEKKSIEYIRQVAEALKCVHSHGRSHFDVKPQNIMVDTNDRAVLIDFGASKLYDEVNGVDTSTLVAYTPGYAPLELSRNDVAEFSPTTDIYSLGATLYNLVTGTLPPNASSVLEDGLPVPVDVSATVYDAIKAAMQPRRKDRPQSVDNFLALLGSGNGDDNEDDEFLLLCKGAEKGDKKAQYRLGMIYYTGKGTPRSFENAVEWFTKAALQGHSAAQYKLGTCYENGMGVQGSVDEAVKWYRLAAEQEHAKALRALERLEPEKVADKTTTTRMSDETKGVIIAVVVIACLIYCVSQDFDMKEIRRPLIYAAMLIGIILKM